MFFCIRNLLLMNDKHPESVYQGFLWFKDLNLFDPYCILPIISAFITS